MQILQGKTSSFFWFAKKVSILTMRQGKGEEDLLTDVELGVGEGMKGHYECRWVFDIENGGEVC